MTNNLFESNHTKTVKSRLLNTPTSKRFSVLHPDLFNQAVNSVGELNAPLEYYSALSKEMVIWKCAHCNSVFELSIYNTVRRGYVACANCVKEKHSPNKAMIKSRQKRNTDNLLKAIHPDIFKYLISCPDNSVDLNTLTVGSSKYNCLWSCQGCKKHFTSYVRDRVKAKHVYCSSCSKTGKSLFEYELKWLLEVSLGIEVISHHRANIGVSEVDLYVPSIDTAIQLDPYWSHYNRHEQDAKNHSKHQQAYSKVIRFREHPLEAIANSITVPKKTKTKEWLSIILNTLELPFIALTNKEYDEALSKANLSWHKSFIEKEDNLSTQSFFDEFIKNIEHPDKHPKATGGKSVDKCLWKCSNGHEYEARISDRNRGRGCKQCWGNRRIIAKPGESIAELYPETVDEFIENLDTDRTPYELKATAADRCIWKCHLCGTKIQSSIHSRVGAIKRARVGTSHHVHPKKTLILQ